MTRLAVVLLCLALLAASVRAEAQQPGKTYRIGYLASLSFPVTLLTDALWTVGLVEGKNVILDTRVAETEDRVQALAAELVRLNPDVIVALWNRDVVAARQATRSIPIVMVIGVDPVGAGLVASLAQPGGM